jgi:transposase InsO family protein
MTPGEIIYHRRVRVLEHAAATTVAEASRVFGVSRKTIHAWKRLAEAVVRPTLGAGRYDEVLAERGFALSRSGAQKILHRSGLGRRRQRVAALAQLSAATTGLVTQDALEGPFGFCHFAARTGDLLALDSFFIGKLKGVEPVWQLTAVGTATRWASREVFIGPSNSAIAAHFVDRTIRKLRHLGVHVTGVLTDNGPEFRGLAFTGHLAALGIRHHRTPPRSPNHNAICKRFQGTALQECWRPAFHRRRFDRLTQLRAEIDSWLVAYNTHRKNRSDFTRGRTPRQVPDEHRPKQAA